ncbi:MAG: hypothetical protein EA380_11940 [Phycisphaeraceae bacterium]|nr:MAG: hypothetical protein EA380_11940 [Phycisphaeraceae bacterium]
MHTTRHTILLLVTAAILSIAPQSHAGSGSYTIMRVANSGVDADSHLSPTLPIPEDLLAAIADILRLTEQQRTLLADLRTGADAQALRQWIVTSEQLRDLSQSIISSDERESRRSELLDRNRDAVREIERDFLDDLRIVLDPEQERRWASIDREIRRYRTLTRYATRPDEALDLAAIVRRIVPDARRSEELREVLNQYAIAVDTPLVARNAVVEQSRDLWTRVTDRTRAEHMTEDDRHEILTQLNSNGRLVGRHAESIEAINRRFWRSFFDILEDGDRQFFIASTAMAKPEDTGIEAENDITNAVLAQSRSGRILDRLQRLDRPSPEASISFVSSRSNLPDPEPLTPEQREALQVIRMNLLDELDTLVRGYRSELGAITRQQSGERLEAFNGFGDPINLGEFSISVIDQEALTREIDERQKEQSENKPNPDLMRRLVEIDQRALKAIREILTIRQRAYIANY